MNDLTARLAEALREANSAMNLHRGQYPHMDKGYMSDARKSGYEVLREFDAQRAQGEPDLDVVTHGKAVTELGARRVRFLEPAPERGVTEAVRDIIAKMRDDAGNPGENWSQHAKGASWAMKKWAYELEAALGAGDGWVACSARLPEKTDLYLAYFSGDISGQDVLFYSAARQVWSDYTREYPVTHWRPLPAPPVAARDGVTG